MPGFPKAMSQQKVPSLSAIGDVTFSAPPAPVERFYNISRVGSGEIANQAVEEIQIQEGKIISRKIVSERDNRIGAEVKLMEIIARRKQ